MSQRPVATARGGRGVPRGLEPAEVARAVEFLAGACRAGLPLARAWEVLAEHPPEERIAGLARTVVTAADRGVEAATALRAEAEGTQAARGAVLWLAVVLAVCARTGAPPVGTLDRFAAALRRELDLVDERTAALAGPRATAGLLSVLPAVALVGGWTVGADPLHALVLSAPGRVCALLGVLTWWLGRVWTVRLIRAAEAAGGSG